MQITSPTSSFYLHVSGYTNREPAGEDYGSKQLQIRLTAASPLGSWTATNPCLLSTEVEALADWLDRLGLGAETEPISFQDPTLEFHPLDRTLEKITLQVRLRLEGELETIVMLFDLPRSSLHQLASKLRRQLASLAKRDQKDTLPPITPPTTGSDFLATVRRFLKESKSPNQSPVRQYLMGAFWAMVLIPSLFFLNFGKVTPVGWGLAVFLSVYCLLVALGVTLNNYPQYKIQARPRRDWLDKIGAFWLVACAFGPFFSWILVSFPTLTTGNWRWLYSGWVFLSIILPLLTSLPLLRYVRGKAALIMLALLLGVTSLPVLSALPAALDLTYGPRPQVTRPGEYLPYTNQELLNR